ncbi:MAG TPA: dipeptidase [Terriglobales bacterium]|nr:dipeptidase [Terriglobales bacterium]
MRKLVAATVATLLFTSVVAAPLFARTLDQTSRAKKRKSGGKLEQNAYALHRSAIVIDTHADTTGRFVDEKFDLSSDAGNGHVDLARMKKGNLGAEFFVAWVDPEKYKGRYAHRALEMIDAIYEQAHKHPNDMVLAFSADDIVRARTDSRKRIATLIGVEGGHAIENNIGILRNFYRLGARYMTLTWMNTNEWADASGDETDPKVQHHGGLTPFGKEIVREMNRLGMMVDVSHVSDKTFWDVINTTKAPVIASHSSARAIANHYRNMDDAMLRAVAKNGGVVQVNFASFFDDEEYMREFNLQSAARRQAMKELDERLKEASPEVRAQAREHAQMEWAAKIPRPPFSVLIDHFDHIAKVAGVDHVGIGSDFDGVSSMPEGMDSAADLPKITEGLMARGYSAEDIRKILGGNLLRVFREVERVSRKIQTESSRGIKVAAK